MEQLELPCIFQNRFTGNTTILMLFFFFSSASVNFYLLTQWAAIHASEIVCMGCVQIFTSVRRPSEPITVVYKLWHQFSSGVAIKSLNRPGIGFYLAWTSPRIMQHCDISFTRIQTSCVRYNLPEGGKRIWFWAKPCLLASADFGLYRMYV